MNITLNKIQLKQVSDVAANLSVLFFGAAVITPLFTNIDMIQPGMIVWGSITAVILLLQSLLLLRGIEA